MKQNYVMIVLFMMIVGNHAAISAMDQLSPQGVADFQSDDDSDEGFEDALQGPEEEDVSFNGRMALVNAQYPATDEYSGCDRDLDRERAKIIQKVVECHRQILMFPAKSLKYTIELRTLKKQYDAVQEKRKQAKLTKEEPKQHRNHHHARKSIDDVLHDQFEQHDYNMNDSSDDDFADYQSFTSQKKAARNKDSRSRFYDDSSRW